MSIEVQQKILQHFININYESDITIAELAKLIASIVGYNGEIKFDTSKPDGTMKKLVDSTKLKALGW